MSISFCSFGLSSAFLLGDCLLTKCAHYANCVPQRDGTAFCSCSLLCSSSFLPVCGSNSRTYWNECFLRREACFMQQNTSVASLKRCSKFSLLHPPTTLLLNVFFFPGAKSFYHIPLQFLFILFRLQTSTKYRSLTLYGLTGGLCFFLTKLRLFHLFFCDPIAFENFQKSVIFLIHFAVTSLSKFSFFCLFSLLFTLKEQTPCSGVKCPFYGTCQLKDDKTQYCACTSSCHDIYKPVCGSDGKSYLNECFLRRHACATEKQISVKYSGLCSKS